MYYSASADIPDNNFGENDSESEPLQKVDNVLVQILNDNSHTTVPVKFKYNAYGQPMKVILNQSEHFGNYVSYEEQLQEEKNYHSTFDRMFRTEGLLKAEENKILDAVSKYIHNMESTDGRDMYFSSKYEYGSINIYSK